jgi:hypothetical protein
MAKKAQIKYLQAILSGVGIDDRGGRVLDA